LHRSTLPIVAVLVLMMAFVGSAHASRPNATSNWCNKVSCPPYAADIVKSQSDATIQVTVTLRDSGSHVSDWGDPPGATCKAGVCDVHVQVYCSTGQKCYVMYYLHDESYTYGGIPPDTHFVNLYVNEKLFLSIDPPVAPIRYGLWVIQLGEKQPDGTVLWWPGYAYPDLLPSQCLDWTEYYTDALGRMILIHQFNQTRLNY
jgi:hypothetical protein